MENLATAVNNLARILNVRSGCTRVGSHLVAGTCAHRLIRVRKITASKRSLNVVFFFFCEIVKNVRNVDFSSPLFELSSVRFDCTQVLRIDFDRFVRLAIIDAPGVNVGTFFRQSTARAFRARHRVFSIHRASIGGWWVEHRPEPLRHWHRCVVWKRRCPTSFSRLARCSSRRANTRKLRDI